MINLKLIGVLFCPPHSFRFIYSLPYPFVSMNFLFSLIRMIKTFDHFFQNDLFKINLNLICFRFALALYLLFFITPAPKAAANIRELFTFPNLFAKKLKKILREMIGLTRSGIVPNLSSPITNYFSSASSASFEASAFSLNCSFSCDKASRSPKVVFSIFACCFLTTFLVCSSSPCFTFRT